MTNIKDIPVILANPVNYNPAPRSLSVINYIVIHYTGNRSDTAKNNCDYYAREELKVSAHYFVDKNEVLCSVPISHAAYAIGGSKYPSCSSTGGGTLNGICRNGNSVSIEICGSVGSYLPYDEAFERAVNLAYQLGQELKIPVSNIVRHFDITGKLCPAWAVAENPTPKNNKTARWTKFIKEVTEMYTAEEYKKFKEMMKDYTAELAAKDGGASAWYASVMKWAESTGIATGGRPESLPTRAEVLTMLQRSTKL